MSVILECQPGDEFVCIQEFHASPDGQGFSWNTARKFRVGERLEYVSYRKQPGPCDHPSEWHVVFEANDGNRYAATQTYFVTEECWQNLKKFFAKRLLRDPKRQQARP
jgi:hypothetical protein